MAANAPERLVLRYFNAWPTLDFQTVPSCWADEIVFDGTMVDANDLAERAAMDPPWREVTLLLSVYEEDRAALLYEGTDAASSTGMRVAQVITVGGGKILKIDSMRVELASTPGS